MPLTATAHAHENQTPGLNTRPSSQPRREHHMNGINPTDNHGSTRTGTPELDAAAVRAVLGELALVCEDMIADANAADETMLSLSEACETQLELRIANHVSHEQPDPVGAQLSMRSNIANNVARERRKAAREFVAWWADVASLALAAAGARQSVPSARVMAADPTIMLSDEDLRVLPEIPSTDRDLTLLAARLATTPAPPGEHGRDMATVALERAKQLGLQIRYGTGEPTLCEDGNSEARRRRLWGTPWTDARAPLLPEPDQLTDWLTRCEIAEPVSTEILGSAREVAVATMARLRAQELEDDSQDGPDVMAEIETLWERADQLTDLLAMYSRKITDALCGDLGRQGR